MYVFERSTKKYALDTLYQTAKNGFENDAFHEIGFILMDENIINKTFRVKYNEQELDILFFNRDKKVVVQMVSEVDIDESKGMEFLKILLSLLPKKQANKKKYFMNIDEHIVKILKCITVCIFVIGVMYTVVSSCSYYYSPYIYGCYIDIDFSQVLFGGILTITCSCIVYALAIIIKILQQK